MSTLESPSAVAAQAPPACAHCGLPVPPAWREPGDRDAFCCAGCSVAFEWLNACGLESYYRLPERRDAPVRPSGRSFEEFDHPAFHALHVRRRADGLRAADLHLEGVHCASCVWLIERLPRSIEGLASSELDLARRRVRMVWDPARLELSAIARRCDRLGYRPHPFRGLAADRVRRDEDRAMLLRIGVAGAIAGNVMLLALALYSGWFSGMEPVYERYFRWVSLLVAAPAILGPARVFFRGALSSLRARALHMDVPIALALVAGFARGAFNTVTDRGPIYFDGVTALIFLLLVGRYLQQRAQRSAADSAELLTSLSPAVARVVEGDAAREVPLEAVLPGMTIEVRPGETVAADGTVLEGRSALDQSLLSGESRPVAAAPGAPVFAGCVNLVGRLRVRVERTGEESRVGRLLREIEAGAARRAPVVLLADRLAGGFVGAVLALGALTAWVWMGRDPARAFDNAIALLIVTCPCALALATPLAVAVAIGRAARRGILIRGGDALERLARPGTLYLDKTGTLTEGLTRLVAWQGAEWARPMVLALERESAHAIAAAFLAAWPGLAPARARGVREQLGGGIEGIVGGRAVAIGSPAFIRARAPEGSTFAPGDDSWTPVLIAVDGRVVARADFADPVRPGAAAVLDQLRARGWKPRLLSGDDPATVAAVGARLGFAAAEREASASPERKLAVIEAASRAGAVVMVGDGVNDAAAIARAGVGIAVSGGAEASLAAADVYLGRPGIEGLVELMDGAERTLRLIRRNIAFSLAYNVVGATLAITGTIHPLIAAILMPASSLTVVLASRLARTFPGRTG